MNSQAESSARSSQQLYHALRDYARSPGKSNAALHEPALLFASFREILQIAADREPEGATTGEERAALRHAACFFVRTALLYPGADHYTLMGLDRDFDSAELKDHYRLLMRLIHPDFAGTLPFTWPADAASRVNLAYEVLSSPLRRSEYENSLAPASKMPSSAKVERRRNALVVRKPHASISRSRFKQLVIIGSAVGIGVALISLLTDGQEPVRLVQRGEVAAATVKPEAEPDPATPAQPQRSPAAAVSALESQKVALAPSELPMITTAAVRSPVPPPRPSPERPATLQNDTRPDSAGADVAQATIRVPAAEQQPAAIPVPVASKASSVQFTAISVAASAPLPVPRSAPIAGVTLGEAQPLLSELLQQLESGLGERVISLLDRDARTKPAAQSLSRQYDSLVEGMRPVRLSHVEFKAEPADGRLVVTSQVYLQVGEQTIGSSDKKIVLRAEFVSRQGTVVMTGLSGVPDN